MLDLSLKEAWTNRGEVCWACPSKKAGLVVGGEAFCLTASRWGGVLGLCLTEKLGLVEERSAGLVIERDLG